MKIYIAGKITGKENYREAFDEAEESLAAKGHSVMNPARLGNYPGFTWEEYMEVAMAMLHRCEAIFMLPDWKESRGATMEHSEATLSGMKIFYHQWEVPEVEE